MNGIYFIILALMTSVCGFLLAKTVLHTGSSSDPIAYAAVSFTLGGLYAAVLYLVTSFHPSDFAALLQPHVLLLLLLDIGVWAIGSCIFYPAYKHLPVSETTIVYSLEGLFAFVFGVTLFKSDVFQALRLLGSGLIVLSVAMVSLGKGRWKANKYGWMLVLSTAIFGFATVVDNTIVAHRYFSSVAFLVIWNFGVTALAILLLRPSTVGKLKTIYGNKKVLATVLINSAVTFLTFFFVYNGYRLHVAASQANMILSSQTVVVVLLGALLFRERQNLRRKSIAGLIAAAGIYLIA